jgi:hypothetical protein
VSERWLTAYWIKSPYPHAPLGFGVTAWSFEDAVRIIRGSGYDLPEDLSTLVVRENVTIADLDHAHVVANMGPIVVRGLWYPFVGVGVPRWMDA